MQRQKGSRLLSRDGENQYLEGPRRAAREMKMPAVAPVLYRADGGAEGNIVPARHVAYDSVHRGHADQRFIARRGPWRNDPARLPTRNRCAKSRVARGEILGAMIEGGIAVIGGQPPC